MTLAELLSGVYATLVEHRVEILLGAAAWPVVGTLLAWIGRGGKSDREGRLLGNIVVAGAILLVALEGVAFLLARLMDKSLLSVDVLLLVAPPVCIAGSLVGIRMLFPLNQLASVRTAVDVGVFLALCAAALWLLSKFRGWGILFLGSIPEMIAIGLLLWGLGKRLYRRAFGAGAASTAG